MKTINEIVEKNMPDIVCLLELLSEHPIINENSTLTRASAYKFSRKYNLSAVVIIPSRLTALFGEA